MKGNRSTIYDPVRWIYRQRQTHTAALQPRGGPFSPDRPTKRDSDRIPSAAVCDDIRTSSNIRFYHQDEKQIRETAEVYPGCPGVTTTPPQSEPTNPKELGSHDKKQTGAVGKHPRTCHNSKKEYSILQRIIIIHGDRIASDDIHS